MKAESSTNKVWSPRIKRTVILITLALLAFLAWQARAVLPLILVGVVLAFLLSPVVDFFDRRLLAFLPRVVQRPLAIVITFLSVFLVTVVIILLVAPSLIGQFQSLQEAIPELLSDVQTGLDDFLNQPLTTSQGEQVIIEGEPVVPEELLPEEGGMFDDEGLVFQSLNLQDVLQLVFQSVGNLTGTAFAVLGEAFNIFLNTVLLVVMIFYLLLDGGRFVQWIIHRVPLSYQDDAQRLCEELSGIWRAYLRGQFVLSISVGLLTFAAAAGLGLPNALTLALLAGLFEFVPNIGPLLALIPASFLALIYPSSTLPFLDGIAFVLVVVLVWGMIQNIESYVLHPRIMGGRLNLHPYVVIVAVIVGASIAGPLGIILAAPGVATAHLFLRYVYARLRDQDPFLEYEFILPSIEDAPFVRAIRWSGGRLIKFRGRREH